MLAVAMSAASLPRPSQRGDKWSDLDWAEAYHVWLLVKELLGEHRYILRGRESKDIFLAVYCSAYRPREDAPRARTMEAAVKKYKVLHWECRIRGGDPRKI